MNFEYPVVFTRDRNSTVIAEVPDVPGTMTVGKDKAEALQRIQDALVATLATYVNERKPLPKPSLLEARARWRCRPWQPRSWPCIKQ